MPIPDRLKSSLSELKRGLQDLYGDRLRAVVLFGSRGKTVLMQRMGPLAHTR